MDAAEGSGAGASAPAARDVLAKHKHSALVVTVIEAQNLTNTQLIAAQVRHAAQPCAALERGRTVPGPVLIASRAPWRRFAFAFAH